jgi:hypothetical protein
MTISFSSPARPDAIAPMRLFEVLEAVRCGGDNLRTRWYISFFAFSAFGGVNNCVLLRKVRLAAEPFES